MVKAIQITKQLIKKESIIDIADVQKSWSFDKTARRFILYLLCKRNNRSAVLQRTKGIFYRDNNFSWSKEGFEDKTRVIGNLQKGEWYKFSRLIPRRYYVYVYVDSENVAYQYLIDQSNYWMVITGNLLSKANHVEYILQVSAKYVKQMGVWKFHGNIELI